MVDAVKRKIQDDLVDEWKKAVTHIQVESARLAVRTEDLLLLRSLVTKRSLGKCSVLESHVIEVADVGSGIKNPSASAGKVKRPRKAPDV